jgi:hypothetical protein
VGHVGGFLRVLRFPPPMQTDRHDIAEIMLKVALNTRLKIMYFLKLTIATLFIITED